jgi:ribokinase
MNHKLLQPTTYNPQPSLVIIGTIGLDDLETPFGKRMGVLGGSGSYSAIAASLFTNPGLISVMGQDFPKEFLKTYQNKSIDLVGVTIAEKTFRWYGSYEFDMNSAKTLKTELNSLAEFRPKVPDSYQNAKYLFLANIDPCLQLEVILHMKNRPFVLLDTMNYWISTNKDELLTVISKVNALVLNDAEARQFTGLPNLISAGRELLNLGPEYVIIKKGEHGSLMFSEGVYFSAPSYPLEDLVDPTGAGDSFSGALMGYLSQQKTVDQATMRKAIIYGSVVASYCAEGFSVERLQNITHKDVTERYEILQKIREF